MIADIIPASFFGGQSDLVLWLLVPAAIALLAFGADRVVSAAASLALALGLSKVIIGATVVSLGTTTPEACVSVAAAFKGEPGLALGNAVGSIIADTGLIFGLCLVIRPLRMDRFVLNRHGWLQFGAGALLVLLCVGLLLASGDIHHVVIPRAAGLGLVALLVGYMWLSVRWGKAHPEVIPGAATAHGPALRDGRHVARNLVLLVVGLALVVMGSELLIGSAKVICERNHVPEAVIAVTLVAFGTSLPELVTAIASLAKGHGDLAVGNVIGADILNVLFVVGAAATASPLSVDPAFFHLFLPTMMVVLALFRAYVLFGRDRFHRWQGIPLLGVYVVFVILCVKMGLAGP